MPVCTDGEGEEEEEESGEEEEEGGTAVGTIMTFISEVL